MPRQGAYRATYNVAGTPRTAAAGQATYPAAYTAPAGAAASAPTRAAYTGFGDTGAPAMTAPGGAGYSVPAGPGANRGYQATTAPGMRMPSYTVPPAKPRRVTLFRRLVGLLDPDEANDSVDSHPVVRDPNTGFLPIGTKPWMKQTSSQ
jgi:hypothetical protein